MYDSAFRPIGPTYFVDENAAVQAADVPANTAFQSYRITNLGAARAYLAYCTPNVTSGTTPTMSKPIAPVSGTPSGATGNAGQQNVIGMGAFTTETFTLPANAWFIASAGATFEVQPGEGL